MNNMIIWCMHYARLCETCIIVLLKLNRHICLVWHVVRELATTTNIANTIFIMFLLFDRSPKSNCLIGVAIFYEVQKYPELNSNIMNQNECRIPNTECQMPGASLKKATILIRKHIVLQLHNFRAYFNICFLIGILST